MSLSGLASIKVSVKGIFYGRRFFSVITMNVLPGGYRNYVLARKRQFLPLLIFVCTEEVNMRIMGLDMLKDSRVAVCDPLGITAQAVETITRRMKTNCVRLLPELKHWLKSMR